MKTNIWYK